MYFLRDFLNFLVCKMGIIFPSFRIVWREDIMQIQTLVRVEVNWSLKFKVLEICWNSGKGQGTWCLTSFPGLQIHMLLHGLFCSKTHYPMHYHWFFSTRQFIPAIFDAVNNYLKVGRLRSYENCFESPYSFCKNVFLFLAASL